jgi:uncharacterized membrane protein YeaQ/YmgE (transglycosylase-associated protein family)
MASMDMRTNGHQGISSNVTVGIVGAILGGGFWSLYLGVSSFNQSSFSVPGLLVSLLGAVILLAIVNFVRRGALR